MARAFLTEARTFALEPLPFVGFARLCHGFTQSTHQKKVA